VGDSVLRRFTRQIDARERSAFVAGTDPEPDLVRIVRRPDGSSVPLDVCDSLIRTATEHGLDGYWANRSGGDQWLAPRLHYALRLTRAEASDGHVWHWLAVRYNTYVTWRWGEEAVEARWTGPVHKQTFKRLWWGAELFRNGADYSPVERAFRNQDVPNSYLHRPLARCRSLTLGLLDVVAPAGSATARTSTDINALVRVVNLALAGSPPELETDFQQDDYDAYEAWIRTPLTEPPLSWDTTPAGPNARDTSERSLDGGAAIARRAWTYAVAQRTSADADRHR
jgi:hypothetical protein